MVSKNMTIPDVEHTEKLPAQEKIASGDESAPALTAEQVYAQCRAAAVNSERGHVQSFIPYMAHTIKPN